MSVLGANPVVARERFGRVCALVHGRRTLGLFAPIMQVRCYAVDGLMIDAGLASAGRQIVELAHGCGVRQAVVTHYHEDHSGGAHALAHAGIEVLATRLTGERMARGFPLKPYEHLVWGRPPRARPGLLGASVETPRHCFRVVAAPGHADDQIALYEPAQGWLFSADAFLGERVKVFRRDEDFDQTVRTLRRLCALDFDALFCAHRPVPSGGKQALQNKLRYLEQLGERVRSLGAQGLGSRRIAYRVLGREEPGMWGLTLGDASKHNLVRSILHGPRIRD